MNGEDMTKSREVTMYKGGGDTKHEGGYNKAKKGRKPLA